MRPNLHVVPESAGPQKVPASVEQSPVTGEPEPVIVREAQAFYRGDGDAERLLTAFRESALWVHRTVSPPAVPVIAVPGLGSWLQAFSSRDRLAMAVGTGDYMSLLGSEVLDLLLPHLPAGAGVLLDPGSPWMMAFPNQGDYPPDGDAARTA